MYKMNPISYLNTRLSHCVWEHFQPHKQHQDLSVLILKGHTGDQFYLRGQSHVLPLSDALRTMYMPHVNQLITYSMQSGLKTYSAQAQNLQSSSTHSSKINHHESSAFDPMKIAQLAQQEAVIELDTTGHYSLTPHDALIAIDQHLKDTPQQLVLIEGIGQWEALSDDRPDILKALQSWKDLCIKQRSLVIFADHNPSQRLVNLYAGQPMVQHAQLKGPCAQEIADWLLMKEHTDSPTLFQSSLFDRICHFLSHKVQGQSQGLLSLTRHQFKYLDEQWLAQEGGIVFDPSTLDLDELKHWLNQELIGQEGVKKETLSYMQDLKYFGSNKKQQPMWRALFAGPPGVGKTELARSLSQFLFESIPPLLINCTEFQQSHEVSKLLGSPPGYVGYGQPSILEKYLDQYQGGVIIFDELEKADEAIHQALMGILEEGVLNMPTGRRLSFTDCVVIATSNAGHRQVTLAKSQIANLDVSEIRKLYSQGIQTDFAAPLLRRFDSRLVFDFLTTEELARVATLHINRRLKAIPEIKECQVEWDDHLIEFICSQVDEQLGAGEMKNVVHHTVNQALIHSFFKVTPRPQKIKLKPPQTTQIMNDMQIG